MPARHSSLLQFGKLLDQLLQPVLVEADGQLRILAIALAPHDLPFAVLGMANARACLEAGRARGCFDFEFGSGASRAAPPEELGDVVE